MNHRYQRAGVFATYQVITAYGTFALCSACVNARHAGLKFGNTATRLPLDGAPRLCDCEHVSHTDRPGDEPAPASDEAPEVPHV